MRYLRAYAAGALAAAVLIGCGPGKELPDEIPKSIYSDQGGGTSKDVVPDKSDPAALEIVERAIKAHTQNNPSLLERGKVSRMTAEGTMKLNDLIYPTRRTFIARFPDEIKCTFELKTPQLRTRTLILKSPFSWVGLDGMQDANFNPEKTKEDMWADGYGMQWLVLLFPLKELKVVLFDPRRGAGVGSPPADVVRVAIPGRPIYRLHVSPSNGFLVQIDYFHTYSLGAWFTEWILAEHKPFGGMVLPTDLKAAHTTERPKFRHVVEEWKVESWEFPEKLDADAFEPPKQ